MEAWLVLLASQPNETPLPVHRQAVASATQVCREVNRQQSIASGQIEFGLVARHNFPLSVFPHPDIREAKFSAERLAFFVFACLMVVPIANREVLAVHGVDSSVAAARPLGRPACRRRRQPIPPSVP